MALKGYAWIQKTWTRPSKGSYIYSRTMDDILPKLLYLSYYTLNNAMSGFWHVSLDLSSSLLTTFKTPWDQFRWLRPPTGLKVSSDVLQERLDKVIRLLPGVIIIFNAILTYRRSEIEHGGRLITARSCPKWTACPLTTTKSSASPKTSLDTD